MSANQQSAQTAATILSGEREFQSVQFVVTGDPQATFMNGVLAVFHGVSVLPPKYAAMVLTMLAERFKAQSIEEDLEQNVKQQTTLQELQRRFELERQLKDARAKQMFDAVPLHGLGSPGVTWAGSSADPSAGTYGMTAKTAGDLKLLEFIRAVRLERRAIERKKELAVIALKGRFPKPDES